MNTVLVCSHTGRETGFGRIAWGIAQSLSAAFQVHVVGLGPGREEDSWSGHPHHRLDPTRTSALSELSLSLKPDAIVLIGQGQLLAWQVTRLRRDGFSGALIPYVPMEGPVHNPVPLAELRASTLIAAYTATGASDLKAALRTSDDLGLPLPPVYVIPHAIDGTFLCASPDRPKLRAKLFPGLAHRSGGIWFLNANRNDYRKRPELTLAAFAPVAAKFSDTMLVLHCSPDRPGTDLSQLRDSLGLQDRVIFTREFYPDSLTEQQLAELYACCDIGVNTALAEGWGLISCEHALSGAAQIVPAHEGLKSIWKDIPLWIPVGEKLPLDDVFFGQIPQQEVLTAAMLDLASDPDQRQQIALRCQTHAADARLGWDRVGSAWRKLVRGALWQIAA